MGAYSSAQRGLWGCWFSTQTLVLPKRLRPWRSVGLVVPRSSRSTCPVPSLLSVDALKARSYGAGPAAHPCSPSSTPSHIHDMSQPYRQPSFKEQMGLAPDPNRLEHVRSGNHRFTRLHTNGGHPIDTSQPGLPTYHRRIGNPLPLVLLGIGVSSRASRV